MKKLVSFALVLALVLLSASAAIACGSHRNSAKTVRYAVCTVENCEKAEVHYHSSRAYTAHYFGDGHDYHEYCGLEDCVLPGYHEHDGLYCFGHTYDDGHEYHEFCSVKNCLIEEYHAHGDVYCLGHMAGDGHSYHKKSKGHH